MVIRRPVHLHAAAQEFGNSIVEKTGNERLLTKLTWSKSLVVCAKILFPEKAGERNTVRKHVHTRLEFPVTREEVKNPRAFLKR